MKKRVADNYLSKETLGDDSSDSPEHDNSSFKIASQETIAKRPIKPLKKSQSQNIVQSNVNKQPTNTTNQHTRDENDMCSREIRGLNMHFMNEINRLISSDCYSILSPCFENYNYFLSIITKEYPNAAKNIIPIDWERRFGMDSTKLQNVASNAPNSLDNSINSSMMKTPVKNVLSQSNEHFQMSDINSPSFGLFKEPKSDVFMSDSNNKSNISQSSTAKTIETNRNLGLFGNFQPTETHASAFEAKTTSSELASFPSFEFPKSKKSTDSANAQFTSFKPKDIHPQKVIDTDAPTFGLSKPKESEKLETKPTLFALPQTESLESKNISGKFSFGEDSTPIKPVPLPKSDTPATFAFGNQQPILNSTFQFKKSAEEPAATDSIFGSNKNSDTQKIEPFLFKAPAPLEKHREKSQTFKFGKDNDSVSVPSTAFTFGKDSSSAPSTPSKSEKSAFTFGSNTNDMAKPLESSAFSFGFNSAAGSEKSFEVGKTATAGFSFGSANSVGTGFSFGTTSSAFSTNKNDNLSFGSKSGSGLQDNSTSFFKPDLANPFSNSAVTNLSDSKPVDLAAATSQEEEDDAMPKEIQLGDTLITARVGEEDETEIHSVKSRIYKFDNGSWNSIGTGLFRLNENMKNKKSRMILRGETGQVLFNHYVTSKMPLSVEGRDVKLGVAESAGRIVQYFARVKNAESGKLLFEALEKMKSGAS